MKTFPIALQAHLDGSGTTLATCMRIVRRDGTVYGFTNHDRRLLIDGLDYYPEASFNPTDIASRSNLDTDNVELEGLLSSANITEDDIRAGYWNAAPYRLFQVNWKDLTQGQKKDRAGRLAQIIVNRSTFVAELLGVMEAYTSSVGEFTSPDCRTNLGDERCKVDLTPFTFASTIDTASNTRYAVTDAARGEADDFFTNGTITITFAGGDLAFDVKSFSGGTFVVKQPIPFDATGLPYVAVAGCDKKRETCRDRFSNIANMRAEPWLRGQDVAVQVARHQ